MEAITSRTAEQEQELNRLRSKLAKLEKGSDSEEEPTNYAPLIIGGCIVGGVLAVVIIAYLLKGNKKRRKKLAK